MKLLATLWILTTAVSCGSGKQGPEAARDGFFRIVTEQANGGRAERSYDIIRSEREWQEYNGRFRMGFPGADTLSVDFRQQAVLALHMGLRNTGGYAVTVVGVTIAGDTTRVKVRERSPGPDDMVTMALTEPYCIAVIDRNKHIVFENE